jgi:hypothetical protein
MSGPWIWGKYERGVALDRVVVAFVDCHFPAFALVEGILDAFLRGQTPRLSLRTGCI